MNTIDVMKQALEALELVDEGAWSKVTENLRAAIEQMEKHEPVAYLSQRTCDSFMVAGYETCERGDYGSFPVYRHPPPAVTEETCEWYEGDDGGPWATQCNELFNIESEGPEANGMKFCCFCGKKLVEIVAEVEEEDE